MTLTSTPRQRDGTNLEARANVGAGPRATRALLGLGRIVALYYCSYSLHTRSTKIIGTSVSETTMRPNPRHSGQRSQLLSLAQPGKCLSAGARGSPVPFGILHIKARLGEKIDVAAPSQAPSSSCRRTPGARLT